MSRENEVTAIIDRVKEILLSHGIKMDVMGCGCCGSPVVSFEYKGEMIADEEDNFSFFMVHPDPEEEQ